VRKKKLVSIETLMKHTGSKEELYRTLTMRGKQYALLIVLFRLDCAAFTKEHFNVVP
jgi:hypothetical protein